MSRNVGFYKTELEGRLWHTTSVNRFSSILSAGFILPEPELADSERWKTGIGPEGYPFVRQLGGVSLFDFRGVDIEEYSDRYPLSNWSAFIPVQMDWKQAIWIQIDDALDEVLINPSDLVARWKLENAYRHTIMPYIEAAYVGMLSTRHFRRVFCVDRDYKVEEMRVAAKGTSCRTRPSSR